MKAAIGTNHAEHNAVVEAMSSIQQTIELETNTIHSKHVVCVGKGAATRHNAMDQAFNCGERS